LQAKTVVIDAPSFDCGAPIQLEMRDDQILKIDPPDDVSGRASQLT